MKKDIKLIVICGPSGVGKTSIASFLVKRIWNSCFCVSHTTRKSRITEMDGIDYYFVSEDKFEQMKSNNEFAEHAHVYGQQYGTSWDVVEEDLEDEIKILDVDYNGAEAIYSRYPDNTIVFSILPPSIKELQTRLRLRGTDSLVTIQQRLLRIEEELEYELQVPHVEIINSDMRETQKMVMKCLQPQ